MEPEGSLPHSQQPALVPVLNQIKPVHTLPYCFLTIHLNIILHTAPVSSKLSFSFRFPHKTLHAPVLTAYIHTYTHIHSIATCSAHLILLYLNLMTQIILDDEYKSCSSSLWYFLQSPITSSFLGPHIFLSTLYYTHSQPMFFS